jgi:NitT/TauT family transport system substrate-binding protein
MKKIIAFILLLTICTASAAVLASCSTTDDYQLKIGYLNGPTGMGMAKLIHDNGGVSGNEKYTFTATTAELVGAAVASGVFDIACMPTNAAATLYNTNSSIEILAVNCLNSIYVITDKNTTLTSFSDLEGKTIYTCKGGTPAPILNALLAAYGINATVSYEFDGKTIAKPEDLPAVITAKNGAPAIVVAPEPIITSASLALKKDTANDNEYSVDIDLGAVWKDKFNTDITMGCIVANKDTVKNHKSAINAFLTEYKASIEYIGNSDNIENSSAYVVDAGIMAAAPAAKTALANLNKGGYIAYLDGNDMKAALEKVYEAFGMKLIGNKMPDDGFYYEK